MSLLASRAFTTRKTSNQSISSQTLADVTDLSFTLSSGTMYWFNFLCVFQADPSVSTNNPQVALTFPSATLFSSNVKHPVTSTPSTGLRIKFPLIATGVGSSSNPLGGMERGVVFLLEVSGEILPSADGVLQLQMSENPVAAPNPFTVYAGSCGIMRRLF